MSGRLDRVREQPFVLHKLSFGSDRAKRVLCVDDDETLVFLTAQLLGGMGYDVTGCTDPSDALAEFRACPAAFDVVVTDLSMPEMSGFDLTRAVLALRPDVPILLLSGHVGQQDHETALRLGVREVLAKPSTIDQLRAALARVLGDPGSGG